MTNIHARSYSRLVTYIVDISSKQMAPFRNTSQRFLQQSSKVDVLDNLPYGILLAGEPCQKCDKLDSH